jgi:hypothetical protein
VPTDPQPLPTGSRIRIPLDIIRAQTPAPVAFSPREEEVHHTFCRICESLCGLMLGTCALPHGWGHQHATGLSVASRTRGVNVNLLAASGPDSIDPLSNMSHLTGIVVDVTRAAGPWGTTSWSGIGASDLDADTTVSAS